MVVKICRLRDPENIRELVDAKPDMMGFDFCSSRISYMGEVDESILANIPVSIRKVGLFSNQSTIHIAAIAGMFNLDAVQLDTSNSDSDCELLSAEGLEVIMSFYISGGDSFLQTSYYEGVCNRFIFKLSTTLDYSILEQYEGTTPFLLSMKMDNIELPDIMHPYFEGYDTANSCEISPTFKDTLALNELVERIKGSE